MLLHLSWFVSQQSWRFYKPHKAEDKAKITRTGWIIRIMSIIGPTRPSIGRHHQPTLGRQIGCYVGRYVGWHVHLHQYVGGESVDIAADIAADMVADTWVSVDTYRPTLSQHIGRYPTDTRPIPSRHSANTLPTYSRHLLGRFSLLRYIFSFLKFHSFMLPMQHFFNGLQRL